MSPRKIAAVVLGVLMLPCLLMAGVGAFFYFRLRPSTAALDSAFGVAGAGGDPSTEARVNLLALCDSVQMYRNEHGVFLPAGPTPREVPRGGKPVNFPQDEAFQKLGFEPGFTVHFQYQVVVQENPVGEAEVTCYARGDLDGDGQNAVYSVTLDSHGMTSPVKVEREGE